MSAEDNLGGQFLTVYRGVREHPDRVRTNFTGTHWTTSLDVAKGFATDVNIGGKAQAPHGTVIEAEVHHDDVVKNRGHNHQQQNRHAVEAKSAGSKLCKIQKQNRNHKKRIQLQVGHLSTCLL